MLTLKFVKENTVKTGGTIGSIMEEDKMLSFEMGYQSLGHVPEASTIESATII